MPYKLVTSHLAHINLHRRPPGLTGSIFLPFVASPQPQVTSSSLPSFIQWCWPDCFEFAQILFSYLTVVLANPQIFHIVKPVLHMSPRSLLSISFA